MLAFLRRHDQDAVLCINNLSRFPQATDLDLTGFEGYTPVELSGSVAFPTIVNEPYRLSISGYSFMWFRLTAPEKPTG